MLYFRQQTVNLSRIYQVPVVDILDDDLDQSLRISRDDGSEQFPEQLALSAKSSAELFRRSDRIRQLTLLLSSERLIGLEAGWFMTRNCVPGKLCIFV